MESRVWTNHEPSENLGFVGKFKRVDANHFTAVIYRGVQALLYDQRLGGLLKHYYRRAA